MLISWFEPPLGRVEPLAWVRWKGGPAEVQAAKSETAEIKADAIEGESRFVAALGGDPRQTDP